MAKKIGGKGGVACVGAFTIGFLDGTLRQICRPGGEYWYQQESFDGHHRAHGIAFQSLVFPNGMIGDLHGPVVGRRHGAFLLADSGLNGRFANMQAGNAMQYKVYGDAAYPILTHIDRGFRGANLTEAQKLYNMELSRVRVSVEWTFGKIVSIYPFVGFKKDLKINLQPVGKYCQVAALLTNAHTCIYESIPGLYFDLRAPSLEEYFA